MAEPIIGVYEIRCKANGKAYVGSSVNVPRRWRAHKGDLRSGKHASPILQSSWNKYGEGAFSFLILELTDLDRLLDLEQSYLDSGKFEFNTASVVGKPMTGRRHTPATRAKMSAFQRKKIVSAETKARMSEAQKRRAAGTVPVWLHTKAVRLKISRAQTGKSRRGTPCTEERKRKIGLANSLRDPATLLRGDKHPRSRAVEIDGIRYCSVKDAAVALGSTGNTVRKRIADGMGFFVENQSSRQMKPWGPDVKSASGYWNSRSVIVGDKTFACCKDAAKAFGIHPSSFHEWITKGKAKYADGLPALNIGPRKKAATK